MKKSIFDVREYRAFLRQQVEQSQNRGLVTRMAEAAECQRSHISRVLSEQLHLTSEQAFRLARFFRLEGNDLAYFMKLVEWGRAGDAGYRASLHNELEQLRQAQQDLSKRMKAPAINDGRELLYYSSWYWSAIHIIVSIPEYQNSAKIAERLNLSKTFVDDCLKQLQEFGLVHHEKGKWLISSGSIHLGKSSPINSIQHSNWRSRAVMAAQNPQDDGIHYTVVQSLSRSDFEKVKQLMLKTIDDYAAIARPSKEEELICFLCDFFKV